MDSYKCGTHKATLIGGGWCGSTLSPHVHPFQGRHYGASGLATKFPEPFLLHVLLARVHQLHPS